MLRTLTLCLVVASLATVRADDAPQAAPNEILQNSVFSDGTTLWHGDCKPAGSDESTDFITSKSNPTGLLIELRSKNWTKVTQELRGNVAPASAVLTVTYQVSSDFKPSDRSELYGNVGPAAGFPGARVYGEIGKISAFIDVPPLTRATSSPAGDYTQITIFDDAVSSGSFTPSTDASAQTVTIKLRPPPPTKESHQTLCLAFPPGHGSITITKISLVPGQ